MASQISFNGQAIIKDVYFDEKKARYYAEITMQDGVFEFPDTSTKLKIPITSEQYDHFKVGKNKGLIPKPVILVGKLEVISQE